MTTFESILERLHVEVIEAGELIIDYKDNDSIKSAHIIGENILMATRFLVEALEILSNETNSY